MKKVVLKIRSMFVKEPNYEVIRHKIVLNQGYVSAYGPDAYKDAFFKL